ncbi:MAG TPA: hypothetical protein VJ717_19205 [Gemmatimonadaceae bacterium]|nr:hypothetical protein [Gemmatimonadaceae bacterium]
MYIILHETADVAPEPGSKLFEACEARGVRFSRWMLAVHFARARRERCLTSNGCGHRTLWIDRYAAQ